MLLDADMAPQEATPRRGGRAIALRLAVVIAAGGGLTALVTWALIRLDG